MSEEIKKPKGRPKKEKDYNSPFAVRLRELAGDRSNQEIADGVGISRQTVGQFMLGNTRPDIDTLCKMADYFNVSADYLLCRTDIKTADTNLQAICEYTGLDEKAVNILHIFAVEEFGYRYIERPKKACEIEGVENDTEFNTNAMNFINDLITDDEFSTIIKWAVTMKEDMAEMKATVPDNENEERAQMILTRQNIKTLHNVKRFVVTDDGYFDLMKERIKAIFGNILDRIIDK